MLADSEALVDADSDALCLRWILKHMLTLTQMLMRLLTQRHC